MAPRRLTFRERDITAAIKAVERAGHKVTRVEIVPDGRIIVELMSSATDEVTPAPPTNPWDEVLEDDAHSGQI